MDRFLFQPNAVKYLQQQQQQPPIEEILSLPIVLSDRILRAVNESKSHKLDCNDVGKKVHQLSEMLRSTVRFANSTPSFYEPPVCRIFTDIAINLTRTLTLVRKCRHRSILRRLVTIVSIADFRKLFDLLDMSIGDTKWLLSVFNLGGEGIALFSSPSITINDPILAWVWFNLASLHLSSTNQKIKIAHELSSLAQDSDRNKNIIIEERGISPLLKLLKEDSSPDAQISGAIALFHLANNQNRARSIFNEHGVPIISHAFRNSEISVQIEIAKLIATMAEHDTFSQEGFARENVIETLVAFLSSNKNLQPPQFLLEFKINCSGALWMLTKGSITNVKKITEANGLLCLSNNIEKEKGEFQINCLMTVMEITSVAEYNPDFRRTAFKSSSPIINQLLRLINESDNPIIKIPAIRIIGHLSRTFPARQTQVIGPLIKQLGNRNPNVGMESVIALVKFTCPDNFLRVEHSKTIFEFEGVKPIMKLLRGNERTKYHALVLLCYLSMYASEPFEQTRLLTALEGAKRSFACNYSELRELVAKASYHLSIANSGLFFPKRKFY